MQDALEAIEDIKEALVTDGSSIEILTITEPVYDPYNPQEGTTVATPTKAFIATQSSNETLNKMVDSYEMSIKFFSDTPITLQNQIRFRDEDYEIVPKGLDEKIYQDLTILYEALIKRSAKT